MKHLQNAMAHAIILYHSTVVHDPLCLHLWASDPGSKPLQMSDLMYDMRRLNKHSMGMI